MRTPSGNRAESGGAVISATIELASVDLRRVSSELHEKVGSLSKAAIGIPYPSQRIRSHAVGR